MIRAIRSFMFLLLSFSFVVPAYADISSDMTEFFSSMGYDNNVTAGGAYKGQAAGYYTGGNLFLRSGARNTQLVSLQLPRLRAGCGGIDAFTGSFSHIRSPELVAALRNIGNNVPAFAFQIALDTISPLIEKHTSKLRELADFINARNINSCEQSAALVGSFWPKTAAAQKNVCQYIGTTQGIFTDAAKARQACGAGGELYQTLEKGKADPEFKELILDEGNLAWKALSKNSFFSSDTQTAELLMSLSGSLIIRKTGASDSAPPVFVALPSLAGNDEVIRALLQGGQATIYECDNKGPTACLNPTLKAVTIATEKAFGNRIKQILINIQDKIRSDQALSASEKGLLEATRLPIYKMLNVNTAYARGSEILGVDSYSDIIASDIVYQYLISGIEEVLKGSFTLMLPQDLVNSFREGLYQARQKVIEKRNTTSSQLNVVFEMIERTQLLEKQLAGVLSADLSNTLKWAKGLR